MAEGQNVRKSPRMSANALATYMSASPTKRESVLREQKFPPTYRSRWYDIATKAITRCLIHPERDSEIIVQVIDRLHATTPADKHERQVAENNAAALESFLGVLPELEWDGLAAQGYPHRAATLEIEGVVLSVRPEVKLSGKLRGSQVRGGVKLYVSKSTRLGEDGGAVIGALLHEFSSQQCDNGEACKQRHCQVIDVFGEDWHAAPNAIKRRLRDIEAACREIRERWPHIRAK
ncbi:MAG: hypothetical protein KF859_08155 [Phycisphaeraceae bacterium]|nr:hypothetical protein [Phycisphaeraceae bacterium]